MDYCWKPPADHTNLLNFGISPVRYNLGKCEGDCDRDSQCANGLKCFQRNGHTTVPGCSRGGPGDLSGHDYCYDPGTPLVHKSWSGTNLGKCQGDCDKDSHCANGFRCFQRNGYTKVPGCAGTGTRDSDYCYKPASHTNLIFLGATPAKYNLGKCEGDCDTDSHCANGFKCFHRSDSKQVPGCLKGGSGDVRIYDYCTNAKVNCERQYGAWTPCSKACGTGTQTRAGSVITPAWNGGNACPPPSESRRCNTQMCPINCGGSYGPWGACNKKCGGGTQTREFNMSTRPSFGGTACPNDQSKSCNTQACCPVVRCPAPERGCTYATSDELNANGCKKYPCGVKKCQKVCSHTKCSFIELPHKVGEQAITIMQVIHDNKESTCSRHETIAKNQYAFHGAQAHCAKVNDKTHADYGKCKCHKLGFHPNGTPVNNAAGSFAGSAAVHGDGTKAGQGLITEADYNTALASHQQNGYNVDASTRDGTDYAAHDGRVHS
jgi:hypothetical protein